VQDALTRATVSPAAYPPVVGALLLARRGTNESDESDWLATVAARLS